MKIILIAFFALLSAFCNAEELSGSTKQEIEHLFAHLESSGCQFNRNGSWYSAAEASVHIRKKYDYLVGKGLLNTSESFIEKAATESSMSGKPYQVKCEGQSVVLSSVWFNNELKVYRSKKSH
jgi:hypothetical protein